VEDATGEKPNRTRRKTCEQNRLAGALPDEYFFIVLSMALTGAVAVWRWYSIFPDPSRLCQSRSASLPVNRSICDAEVNRHSVIFPTQARIMR